MARIWLNFKPNDLPIVTVRIGKDYFKKINSLVFLLIKLFFLKEKFGVDTGAKYSIITPLIAARYELTISGHGRLAGIVQQTIIAPTATISNVSLASVHFEPFTAFIADIEHLRLGIQMIIGVNALRNRRIQIDFSAGKLYILE
ncbi:hypothetical protein FJZ31_41210 [Candidatus Poribacteria bacterium]|nr:hypothetical protein [Candidatus Poribacteria bacterium]